MDFTWTEGSKDFSYFCFSLGVGVFNGFGEKNIDRKRGFSLCWMCSLCYGTGPWSSASDIPAKWLYEWRTQWQLFLSDEHLCKIWSWIFLFIEQHPVQWGIWFVVENKRKFTVLTQREHSIVGEAHRLLPFFFSTTILFRQSRDIYCISLIFGRLFRRGDSSYLYSHLRVPTNTLLLLSDRFTLDLPCEGSVKTFKFCKLL